MFLFTQEPSSGSQSQCLTKITRMFLLCRTILVMSEKFLSFNVFLMTVQFIFECIS